ncbi:MAG TPA: ankyrin repeat domain-containing protein [Chthonomonadaceae bacterium]|nr:ankyrin repeat domain-containing protein [Chthonomonadaceae bacterium]
MGSLRIARVALLCIVLLLIALGGQIYLITRQGRLDFALITAIQKDDTPGAIAALKEGADANAVVKRKPSHSFWKILLDRWFDRSHRDPHPPTALLVALGDASASEINKDDAKIINVLLEHGANPNAMDTEGYRPLQLAQESGRLDIMRMLLDHGANPDVSYPYGLNALDRAALWGDPNEIELLLSRGANINIRDQEGKTPLMYAVENQREENIRSFIAHHADLQIKDPQGHTVLTRAQKDLAANIITSNHHTEDPGDVWRQIILMLKKAGAE